MKKVLLLLFLFLSCYFIYNKTIDNNIYYLAIGDFLSSGINEYGFKSYGYSYYVRDYLNRNKRLKDYNVTFTESDYYIKDIVRILEYNEEKNGVTLNRLIKKADIISISLGMNEIYYKLNNTSRVYSYIDDMFSDYDVIFRYINKFSDKEVYVLGYYNITGKNSDIFEYANFNLKKLCDKYGYYYIDLANVFDNNPNFFSKSNSFIPNIRGYEKISQIIVEKMENN